MRLTSLTDYAVVMLSAAARHAPDARLTATLLAGRDRRAAADRAEADGPARRRRACSHSARGTGGGFVLARAPAAISLADIVEAVEGPIAMTACVEDGRHDCGLEGAAGCSRTGPRSTMR